jgi:hypothetical protein
MGAFFYNAREALFALEFSHPSKGIDIGFLAQFETSLVKELSY